LIALFHQQGQEQQLLKRFGVLVDTNQLSLENSKAIECFTHIIMDKHH
jgi:hypothetical protein